MMCIFKSNKSINDDIIVNSNNLEVNILERDRSSNLRTKEFLYLFFNNIINYNRSNSCNNSTYNYGYNCKRSFNKI